MHYPLYFQMKCGKNPKDCHLICIFRNTVLGMVILGMFSLSKRKSFISMCLFAKIMDHEDNADWHKYMQQILWGVRKFGIWEKTA